MASRSWIRVKWNRDSGFVYSGIAKMAFESTAWAFFMICGFDERVQEPFEPTALAFLMICGFEQRVQEPFEPTASRI